MPVVNAATILWPLSHSESLPLTAYEEVLSVESPFGTIWERAPPQNKTSGNIKPQPGPKTSEKGF
jgi:hypothetical protein